MKSMTGCAETGKTIYQVFFISFFGLLVCAVLLIATTPARAEPVYGGTVRLGTECDLGRFEILRTGGLQLIDTAAANLLVHERLFGMDENGNLIPELALSAESSEDGKTWTIKLREGVRFHDGTPFNADAVTHHWNRMLDPENKYRGHVHIKPIQSVEKVDETTVRFHLAHAWIPFLAVLTDSRHLAAFIPSPVSADNETQNRQPVGTGPFKFLKWEGSDRLVLEKNTGYWQEGKPYLDQIVFIPMPDHQTRFASLQTGQLEISSLDLGDIIEQAKKIDSLQVLPVDGNGAEIFIFNAAKPPLDDIRVRQALAHACNQMLQIKVGYQGSLPEAEHPFGAGFGCGDVGYREYDLEKAKKLIADVPKPIKLECLHTNTARGRVIGELTQRLFKEIGVELTPVPLAVAPHMQKVISGDYQMSTWRIPPRKDMGSALLAFFHSKSRSNFDHYSNPEVDRLVVEQLTCTDADERKRMFCQVARIINEDVPILYRGGRRHHLIFNKHLKNVSATAEGLIQLRDAWLEE